jgi:hypothetical protein
VSGAVMHVLAAGSRFDMVERRLIPMAPPTRYPG